MLPPYHCVSPFLCHTLGVVGVAGLEMPWQSAPPLIIIGGAFALTGALLTGVDRLAYGRVSARNLRLFHITASTQLLFRPPSLRPLSLHTNLSSLPSLFSSPFSLPSPSLSPDGSRLTNSRSTWTSATSSSRRPSRLVRRRPRRRKKQQLQQQLHPTNSKDNDNLDLSVSYDNLFVLFSN